MEWLTGDEALEERLVREVLVVLLEVLLGGRDHLDGDELVTKDISSRLLILRVSVPSLLETADDIANKSTLQRDQLDSKCSVRETIPGRRQA